MDFVLNAFSKVEGFFRNVAGYMQFGYTFFTFIGLFLLTVIIIFISTSHSYEVKLVKAIDMLNAYFMDTPQITEENLVAFNQKMKSRKVPKQLKKQWQQFVLYREEKASYYMSFENCVSQPIRNSTYKRDISIMNIMAYLFAGLSVLLCVFRGYDSFFSDVLQKILLTPTIILTVNYILSVFLNLRHNAIVSDLYQNYQYFEVNIDKATKTLPEYVDYEVLFDKNEIKRGIPILYTYLQKRAEEEQRELEKIRLKNIEHEKFNFDQAGVAGSLVLERAMQEAENYIAERKKYNEDTAQINSDITQEDINYREITKEYNRQMQVSKETFANFKAQLEEASSTIEANYLKKQQQQELDRQRNLERDFDIATEKHKKIIEGYHQELDTVDKFREQSKQSLENGMMSEFETYSLKVYSEAQKIVEQREKEKFNNLKSEIKKLEEKLVEKEQELNNVYAENQDLSERLQQTVQTDFEQQVPDKAQQQSDNQNYSNQDENSQEFNSIDENTQQVEDFQQEENDVYNYLTQEQEPDYTNDNNASYSDEDYQYNEETGYADYDNDHYEETTEDYNPADYENVETEQDFENYDNENEQTYNEPSVNTNPELDIYADDNNETVLRTDESLEQDLSNQGENFDEISTEQNDESLTEQVNTEETAEDIVKNLRKASEENKQFNIGGSKKINVEESNQNVEKVSKRGRPRKVKTEETEQKVSKRGRPKKQDTQVSPVKKGRGRPKKVTTELVQPKTSKRGRPRKINVEEPNQNVEKVSKRGRPRKVEAGETEQKVSKRGRPKKQATQVKPVKKGRGRPKKTTDENPSQNSQGVADIEAYIKEIDDVIAKENARLEETKKQLAKNAKLKKKK